MNQGKLDVVKQGMEMLSIDILGISELRWLGMDKFSQIILTTVGKNPLEEKSLKCSTWMQSQK